jgi:hypothetical protein
LNGHQRHRNYMNVDERRNSLAGESARSIIEAQKAAHEVDGERASLCGACGSFGVLNGGKSRISAGLPSYRSVDAYSESLYSVAGSRSEGFDAHP